MYPTVTIGDWTFSSYVAAHAAYLMVAAWLATRLAAREGVAPGETLRVFAIGVPAGVMGAHALAVIETWERSGADPLAALLSWQAGSAIFGGLLAGVGAGAAYGAWRGLPLRRLLDAWAPVMALGEAMTRIGCFLAGCCHGKPTESVLGIVFPRRSLVFSAHVKEGLVPFYGADAPLPVHPTQLYSAGFGLVLFVVLLRALRRPRGFDGRVFCLFLGAYGAWRFVLFYLRADPGSLVLLGLYSSQLWSLVAVAVAVALAWRWRARAAAR
jgi:phosphatidylglycerol:prolipoprotein diacylglycerol transferase